MKTAKRKSKKQQEQEFGPQELTKADLVERLVEATDYEFMRPHPQYAYAEHGPYKRMKPYEAGVIGYIAQQLLAAAGDIEVGFDGSLNIAPDTPAECPSDYIRAIIAQLPAVRKLLTQVAEQYERAEVA